jgi:hypothetical protein
MKKNNVLSHLTYNFSFASLISLSSLVKFSWLVGSQTAFFSGINIAAPLSGAFGGIFGSLASYLLRTLTYLCLFGTVSIKCLTLGIPNFFASLYWGTNLWIIRAGIPLLCMFLFWAHPVGFSAGAYAFYWFIPVAVHFLSGKNIFFQALGSTFVAHAVGSVIWLYAMPMTPAVWLALIPVVAVERLLFATGMVIMHYAINQVMQNIEYARFCGQKIKGNTQGIYLK